MMYNSIFSKSFSRYEQKRLGYGALVACLMILLGLCTVFKPYLGPIHDLNLRLSISVDTKMLMLNETSSSSKITRAENIVAEILADDFDTKSSPQKNDVEVTVSKNHVNDTRSSSEISKVEDNATKILINDTSSQLPKADVEEIETKKVDPICFSEKRTDFCQTRGDIRVHGKSSSVYIVSTKTTISPENISRIIKPYARKGDAGAMDQVREWSINPEEVGREFPQCAQHHSTPAVLFSTGGYVGNHFHEFTDIIIPLFLTSRQYNGEVKFIITDMLPWFSKKYKAILSKLSNYEIMDIDKDDEVHCFPSVHVGLQRYPKELSIDPQKYSYSIKDFREFLRSSFSLKRVKAMQIQEGKHKKPRLLILSRRRSRSFTNIAQIAEMAKRLGFKTIMMEAGGNMSNFAEVVNSCDVLLGVHGAGLTNILFLPENAVFIQVVPYGGVDWLAKFDFELPSKEMGLKYLKYKIKVEESTLIQQYPQDHVIIKDPESVKNQGWLAFKAAYLDQQNVILDIDRFKPTLQKALELLHQ